MPVQASNNTPVDSCSVELFPLRFSWTNKVLLSKAYSLFIRDSAVWDQFTLIAELTIPSERSSLPSKKLRP